MHEPEVSGARTCPRTASQPRSLTAGGALSNRDEPPEVLLAVERAREALAVCERLWAGRVEEWPRTRPRGLEGMPRGGAPWDGSGREEA